MWICANRSFLSIVDKAVDPDCLLVRARRPGDIENYFPNAKVKKTVGNDYLFRAEINREEVASVVAAQVMGIKYDNFKDSVADDRLHSAYSQVWHTMARLQPIAPYSRGTRGQGALL